jgi:hypothetical protein
MIASAAFRIQKRSVAPIVVGSGGKHFAETTWTPYPVWIT